MTEPSGEISQVEVEAKSERPAQKDAAKHRKLTLSRSRTQEQRSQDPLEEYRSPLTAEERARAQDLFAVLDTPKEQLIAAMKEKDNDPRDTFQGDVILLMADMRKNPLIQWSTDALNREIKRWEKPSHQLTASQEKIRADILKFLNTAVIEKMNEILRQGGTREDMQDVWNQVYHEGKQPPMNPVHVEYSPHTVRDELLSDVQRAREEMEARKQYVREDLERRARDAERIKDADERAAVKANLKREKFYIGDVVSSFEDSPPERQRAILTSLGSREKGYGLMAGAHGEYSIRPPEPESGNSDWTDYFAMKKQFFNGEKSWDAYGWTERERREISAILRRFAIVQERDAEQVMAAVLLHGRTGEEFLEFLKTEVGPSRQQIEKRDFDAYLDRLGVLRDDDDVLEVIYTQQERTEYLVGLTYREPQSFEDLAFQIVTEARTNTVFKRGQAMPILSNVVREGEEDSNGIKRFVTEERVDADNMAHWLFATAIEAHGNATTSPLDFEQQVQVKKGATSIPITIYEMMLGRTGNMFKSKYGDQHKNGWVADELEGLAIILAENRNSAIQIQQIMGDAKQLGEHRFKELVNSNMTRDVGGTSLLELMLKISERGNRLESGDGKIGAMILTAYLSYCNLNNLEGLAKTLVGEEDIDALRDIFSLDKLRNARDSSLRGRRSTAEGLQRRDLPDPDDIEDPMYKKVGDKVVSNAGDLWLDLRLGSEIEINEPTEHGVKINKVKLSDIFDKDGKPKKLDTEKQREKFIKFINFFTHVTPDARLETVIRGVISDQAGKLHGVRSTKDGYGVPGKSGYADLIAHGMMYRFGMYFYLDNSMSGRSEETKLNAAYLRDRIKKDAHAGNPYLLGLIPPKWLLPEALVVSTTKVGKNGQRLNMQNAFIEAHEVRVEMDLKLNKRIDEWFKTDILNTIEGRAELEKRKKELAKGACKGKSDKELSAIAEEEMKADKRDKMYLEDPETRVALRQYNEAAGKQAYDEAAEKNYFNDSWQKGFSMDDRFTGAHELAFDRYIKPDAMSGPTVNMQEWVKDAAKFFNQTRKYQTGTNIFYGTTIPVWNEKEQKMVDTPIGETMIGKQVLNKILEDSKFWKGGKKGGEVDWAKVTSDGEVWKWMEAGFIVGQLLQYTQRSEWNLNPRYSYALREAILGALQRLPGDFVPDLDDARGGKPSRKNKYYFNRKMRKWIRKASGTGYWKSFALEALSNVLLGAPGKKDGFFSGLGDLWALFAKASLQGVGG